MDIGISGKVALVTGGGQGVGRCICKRLAEEGAKVVVNDLVQDRAAGVANEISEAGGVAIPYGADVTNLEQVQAMVESVKEEFGAIAILVNNAGIIPERRTGEVGLPLFGESNPEDWSKIVNLNIYGVANSVYSVLPGMIEASEGKIVSIISDAGLVGERRFVIYSGAKAAVLAMSKSLARELGKHSINVNAISLAAVSHESPMADFLREDATAENNEILAKVLRSYPLGSGLGRLTRPADAANAVLFLASPRAEYITGQCLPVNGGYSM